KRSTDAALRLLLQPRNVPRSKLPAAITFHQSIRELHDTVERLAFRCSFHPRLSEYNPHVIAIESRQHVVVFENSETCYFPCRSSFHLESCLRPTELARRSSLFPTSFRRLLRTPVPFSPI